MFNHLLSFIVIEHQFRVQVDIFASQNEPHVSSALFRQGVFIDLDLPINFKI